jgi:transcriptional regulator GlxA family with amidase domain
VSKRYLQAVFADSADTVMSTIREMRLQRCREALRSPALRNWSVTQIAMQWGFAEMANFCRAYKTRFDTPPSRDRGLH